MQCEPEKLFGFFRPPDAAFGAGKGQRSLLLLFVGTCCEFFWLLLSFYIRFLTPIA